MSTPEDTRTPLSPIPTESYSAIAEAAAEPLVAREPNPDDPPWGIPAAVTTWVGSIVLLFGMSLISAVIITLILYSRHGNLTNDQLIKLMTTDKTAVLLQVIAVIPAHLLTLLLAWAVVTNMGKRPFWRTLGWTWGRGFGVWMSIGLAVLLLVFGGLLTKYYGGEPTDIDQIINSSTASRFVLAFLAVVTAPLVEEIIYRGILYSALQRAIGVAWSVVAVTILFAAVHVAQYYNNISVIAAIGVLSLSLTLVRAYTKSLLPCFVIHIVFNGIQSLYIVLYPYVTKPETQPVEQSGLLFPIAQLLGA